MSILKNVIFTHDDKKQLAVVAAYEAALAVERQSFNQDTPFLWIANSNGLLGFVDRNTGGVEVVGNMGVTMSDIAFDSKGNLYGLTFNDLYSINKVTAQATLIGPHNQGDWPKNSLVFGPDDALYAAWNALYAIDPKTGTEIMVANGGSIYKSIANIAFGSDKLYVSSQTNVTNRLVQLDKATGKPIESDGLGLVAVYGLTSNKKGLYRVSNEIKQSVASEEKGTIKIGAYEVLELNANQCSNWQNHIEKAS